MPGTRSGPSCAATRPKRSRWPAWPPTGGTRCRSSRGDVAGAEAPKRLAVAMAGADAVVHLVAIPRDLAGGRDLLRVNLDGTPGQ